MIVKIKINEELTMMFGDSYKSWHMQFDEWVWSNKDKEINAVSVETSSEKWIGWGGLKWCPERLFQKQLNREGCQSNEPDNSNPRQYSQMTFKKNPIVEAKIRKILQEYIKAVNA